jgi:hypothetical protein
VIRAFDAEVRPNAIALVGDYGSGKTEVAVNLALDLARERDAGGLAIADLDLVNPYFRCREACEPLEQAGIRVVMPRGGQQHADLPILLPQVKGLLQDPSAMAILDVGGDEAGSRVLAGLAGLFERGRHALWFVLNGRRPFNDSVEGCVGTISRVQRSTGLEVTGLVSNTHLMDETTPEMVLEGVRLAEQVAAELGAPLRLVAVMEQVAAELPRDAVAYPLLVMRRIMVPPWRRRQLSDQAAMRLGIE